MLSRTIRSPRHGAHISALCLLGLIALACAARWNIDGAAGAHAQVPPVNGMRPSDPRAHAIVDATIIPTPGSKIEHGVIVIRDGVIEAVGPAAQVTIPEDARIWPAQGLFVYAGLIDPAVMVRPSDSPRGPAAHWNARVHPELRASEQSAPDAALRKELRGLGFTVAAVYPATGAIRGSGTVVALAEEQEHVRAYRERAAMAMAFDYGGFGPRSLREREASEERGGYPSSLIGAIALLRQTLYDAQWHAACRKVWEDHPVGNEPPIRADSLEALAEVVDGRQDVLFEVGDELNAMRAARIAAEFKLDLVLLGSGFEFRRLSELAAALKDVPIILPLNFPKRPEVSTESQADAVSLRDLMTWEQAPTNPRRLLGAGLDIALTTHALKSRSEFHANLRNAIKHGLSEDQALEALTVAPAKMLGLQKQLGAIEPGKVANLVIVEKSLFDKDARIRDVWVNGRRCEVYKEPDVQLKGSGTLKAEPNIDLNIELDTLKSTVTLILPEDKKVTAKKVIVQQDQLSFVVEGRPFGVEGYVRLTGVMTLQDEGGGTVQGSGTMPDGSMFSFTIQIEPGGGGGGAPPENPPAIEPPAPPAAAADPAAARAAGDAAAPQPAPRDPVTGTWTFVFEQTPDDVKTMQLQLQEDNTVTITPTEPQEGVTISQGKFDPASSRLTYVVTMPDGVAANVEATITGENLTGKVTSERFTGQFTGHRLQPGESPRKPEESFTMPPEELNLPFGEYGLSEPPRGRNLILENATIWTCGPEGVIKRGTLVIKDGKVLMVAAGTAGVPAEISNDDSFEQINCTDKHITPGLIDCHSHTGISGGVNEGGQACSAETRIADAIDPDDIDWYRELAGGLTACNQLHGSANPIGGQNSVVKLKWGGRVEDLPIPDAIAGIKFALGENVKRGTGRYPNTRMGVETFIRDSFTAARDYKARWERRRAMSAEAKARTMPPPRDLELDALVEILEGTRLVHCHSYRQDEILMLIRVADDFGFRIGTFQHVLEGYKVADAIAAHGAGGSSFSDWWAYKMEVMDAIPYNGAIMHDQGVLVSFNSDSDELARRMNTEAAKAVRYGGIAPEEALKFVTLNPARQLRIDNRAGSLEQGKDADFVIWSGDPLSTYSRCEQTWIEGALYFDLQTDEQLRQAVRTERQRIIQKILAQAHGEASRSDDKPRRGGGRGRGEGDPSASPEDAAPPQDQAPPQRPERLLARMLQQQFDIMKEKARRGEDPDEIRPGECGCYDLLWSFEQ